MCSISAAKIPPLGQHDLDRFWSRVSLIDLGGGTCWPWDGNPGGYGYGRFSAGGRQLYAHRVAYAATYGDPGADLVIDHACRNRTCCNPSHLRPITREENSRIATRHSPAQLGVLPVSMDHLPSVFGRPRKRRPSSCSRGHLFTPRNTYVKPNGCWDCRTCHRIRQTRRRAKETA